MEWSAFVLDVMYLVMIALLLFTCGVLLVAGHVAPALFCLVPAGLSAWCVRYRLKVARYYLGRRR
jgi:hypothetical protein